jgi:hypothetical protein
VERTLMSAAVDVDFEVGSENQNQLQDQKRRT